MKRRTLLTSLLAGTALAQTKAKPYLTFERREFTAPELKDAPDEWIDRSLAWVDDMLQEFPPAAQEHPVRRAVLIRLDDILHIESAPAKANIHAWFKRRMEKAAAEVAAPIEGTRIWKLYNDTFLVRTPSTGFVFDLVPGMPRSQGFRMTPETLAIFVKASDALFVSHWHNDHANVEVGKLFFAAGKPVFGPNDIWREEPALREKLTVPSRNPDEVLKAGKLKLRALPGHQGKTVTNNINLVTTPEGFTFAQTGDQSLDEDFAWIDEAHKKYKIDVLMPNCWTNDPLRMAKGFAPKLILPGHENEMAHTVDHREDWTQTYTRWEGARVPVVTLAWGESIAYPAR